MIRLAFTIAVATAVLAGGFELGRTIGYVFGESAGARRCTNFIYDHFLMIGDELFFLAVFCWVAIERWKERREAKRWERDFLQRCRWDEFVAEFSDPVVPDPPEPLDLCPDYPVLQIGCNLREFPAPYPCHRPRDFPEPAGCDDGRMIVTETERRTAPLTAAALRSHRFFAFAAAIVCHCRLSTASMLPQASGVT